MIKEIGAVRRLKEVADLNDAQIEALRIRVLPMLKPLAESRWVRIKWRHDLRPRSSSSQVLEKVTKLSMFIRAAYSIVNAAIGKGKPAQRYSALTKALTAVSPGGGYAPIRVEKLILTISKLLPEVQKAPELLPEVKDFIQDLIHNPTLPLLVKSWKFILKELSSEMLSLLERHKFVTVDIKNQPRWDTSKTNPTVMKYAKAVDRYVKQEGFIETAPEDRDNEVIKAYSKEVENGIIVLEVTPAGIRPGYRLDSTSSLFTWARLGVSDGVTEWRWSSSVESLVEDMVEKVVKVLAARAERQANGIKVDFGGGKIKTLLPAELDLVLKVLRAGSPYSINPPGFGTGYSFSIRKTLDSKLASEDISRRVGQPVYYTTYDRD